MSDQAFIVGGAVDNRPDAMVIPSNSTQVIALQSAGPPGPQGIQGVQGIQGIVGPAGPASAFYKFSQITPLFMWNINHNLGFYPTVSIVTLGLQQVEASVVHVSLNQTQIYFDVPFAGFARLT